jgi:hypothetical protein
MSDAVYIIGTDEYVVWEIECEALGFTFVPADWTAKAAMVARGVNFIDEAGSFTTAALSTVDGKYYGKAKLADLHGNALGTYRVLTRLTKTTGGVEIPLLRAKGTVTVTSP